MLAELLLATLLATAAPPQIVGGTPPAIDGAAARPSAGEAAAQPTIEAVYPDPATVEDRGDELYASVNLASLQVGTVGGGTDLATQSEALELMGMAGGGDPVGSNADAFAEVVATGALAGELSLVSALAARHLSSAHEDLGR
mgnify:CR=1 FL=1